LDDAKRMLKDSIVRSQGSKPLFTSDELSHRGTVLGEPFYELAPPVPSGKLGRPRSPDLIISMFSEMLAYPALYQ
jgi:hypothetical protein